MRVLMLGWEFPPYVSGGLGTACYNIARSLSRKGTEVLFFMPNMPGRGRVDINGRLSVVGVSGAAVGQSFETEHILRESRDLWASRLVIQAVDSPLFPYATQETYEESIQRMRSAGFSESLVKGQQAGSESRLQLTGGYGPNLMDEVYRYGLTVAALAQKESFDVIHAHDWMTYPAAILVKRLTGKPLVTHIHATEFDRSGLNKNAAVARIEWAGMNEADTVVAVSHYTKNLVVQEYALPEKKVVVVHNAVSRSEAQQQYKVPALCQQEKRVLFMGRVTFQKGPDYFVEAARMVLNRIKGVHFIMAGSGDMLPKIVKRVAQLRMGKHFHFTGFLRGAEVDRMYAQSSLYVMPSVSEPFGIAPLEALCFDVPVLITRQSGVAEVLKHALRVDFWDVREMANTICAVLSYPTLMQEVVSRCREEIKDITWDKAAMRLNDVYRGLTGKGE